MELSNAQHETFAQHVVAGMTLTEAAKRAGYKPSGANNMGSRLGRDPVIAMRIKELREFFAAKAQAAIGVRNPQSRVQALEDRWERMRAIIEERSKDPSMQAIPGGKTGLLISNTKSIGAGETAVIVTEYRLDTELVKELRAHEQQAAEELGQWVTRKEQSNQSLTVTMNNPSELHAAIKAQLANLPPAERSAVMSAAPKELREAIELESSVVTDRMGDDSSGQSSE